jgi:hypothetical protein
MKFAIGSNSSSGNHSINFGQRPFAYTPPTGYKKLNTYNLSDSSIKDGSKYFDTKLWTGNGTSQTISGLEFAPDLVWGKSRSTTGNHVLVDSIRGDNTNLNSNLTNAESSGSSISNLVNGSFDVAGGGVNASSVTMVGWSWRASDSAPVTNTDGDITTTVSANTTSGFSVVTYTGAGTSAGTVGHGLGVAPKVVIAKSRDSARNWAVYHASLGINYLTELNTTSGAINIANYWGSTSPTSEIFGVYTGNNFGNNNYLNEAMVAYCFADVEGFSKFGKYTGNGSTDGPFIYTGFRPSFVIIKKYSATDSWVMHDTSRSTYNQMESVLYAELTNAESTATAYGIDCVSNGFKIRETGDDVNTNGASFIYMAFAESPFKNSLAR